MANDVVITNLTSINGQVSSAVTSINNNFANVKEALLNTLALDGTSPNQMEANLDMNSFRILNLPQPLNNTDPIRLIDVTLQSDMMLNVGISSVLNNTSLNNLSTLTDTYLIRLGFNAPGDSPPVLYKAVASVPTNLDGCTQVQSLDGKTWQAQFINYVTPEMWGAKGDGVTDDTVPLTHAMTNGLPCILTKKYVVTGTINIALASSSSSLFIQGKGSGSSQILLTTATAGFNITIGQTDTPWGAHGPMVTMRDFCIVPMFIPSGPTPNLVSYVKIIGSPASIGSSMPTFLIDNVNIIPGTLSAYQFSNSLCGFEFFDCRNCIIQNSNILGGNFSGSGIKYWGSTASAPTTFSILNCQIVGWNKGVELAGNSSGTTSGNNDWEGVVIKNCVMTICNYCVWANSVDHSSDALYVTDCNFSFVNAAVYTNQVLYVFIRDNFMLDCAFAGSGITVPAQHWGISVNQSSGGFGIFGTITGNQYLSSSTCASKWIIQILDPSGGGNTNAICYANYGLQQNGTYAASPAVGGYQFSANNWSTTTTANNTTPNNFYS